MDKLPVRHHDGPARRARDVDEPTHRSFARPESNGRPCRTVRHEGWWCAVARPVAPPAEPAQQKPTRRRSGPCRRIECSSYGPFWPGSALFQDRRQLFKHPLTTAAEPVRQSQRILHKLQLCIDAAGGSLLNSSSGTDTEIYFLRFAGLALTTAQLLRPNTLRRNLRSTAGFRRTKILRLSKALGLRL